MANLTDGWGRFTEGLIIPSLTSILLSFGIDVKAIYQRAKRRKEGKEMEIDILNIAEKNGKDTITAVEAKTYLRRIDIDDFVSGIKSFPYFFEEFMNCEKGVDKYAESKGLYALGPSDDIIGLLNKKDFKPKIFKFL